MKIKGALINRIGCYGVLVSMPTLKLGCSVLESWFVDHLA